mgnify:CR=1 FL=1
MSHWRKSARSPNGSVCVEAREHEHGVDVCDTKHRVAEHLTLTSVEWLSALRVAARDA